MRLLNLTDLEMMSMKIIVGCIAFLTIVLSCSVCMAMSIKVDPAFLWPIFAAICAFAGISAAQFTQFRKTDWVYVEKKGEADAKVAAAACETAPSTKGVG